MLSDVVRCNKMNWAGDPELGRPISYSVPDLRLVAGSVVLMVNNVGEDREVKH
jgi:hypothetical protein